MSDPAEIRGFFVPLTSTHGVTTFHDARNPDVIYVPLFNNVVELTAFVKALSLPCNDIAKITDPAAWLNNLPLYKESAVYQVVLHAKCLRADDGTHTIQFEHYFRSNGEA